MEFHGEKKKKNSMDFRGPPWTFHRPPWTSVDLHGLSMDLNGVYKFHGIPFRLQGNLSLQCPQIFISCLE
jgi:hypothetical protein